MSFRAEHKARQRLSDQNALLRESEERFRATFADAPVGIALLDRDGVILEVNNAFCRLNKRPGHELVGRSCFERAFAEDREAYTADHALRFDEGGGPPIELRFCADDGSELWLRTSTSLITQRGDAVLLAHVQDMTDQRRMQVELEERNAQLLESDRLKDELISVVSHDLRTPLTSIIGYLELALDSGEGGDISDERRAYLEVAQRNSQRLGRLVEDLLFVSRAKAGRASLALAPVDVSEVVREAVDATLPTAGAGGVSVSYDGAPDATIVGDAHRVSEVIENLLSNAVKFTEEGGRVDVSVAGSDEEVVVRVSDTGRGIDAADLEHLFERFFRASDSEGLPGAGLGLAIVKAIVDAHGGTIGVTSRAGAGTAFEVRFRREGPAGERVAHAA